MRYRSKKSKKPPPEGPEVKIIGEELSKIVGGKILVSVTPLAGRYVKAQIDGLDISNLPAKVLGVGVKGKLIFWLFDNDAYMLNTLAMTGGWTLKQNKSSRVRFTFVDGMQVYFNDSRNFGTLKFVRGRQALMGKLNSLGPDMLSDDVSQELFEERMTLLAKETTLAEALMDQNVICGVGNYVKAEALWRAKLSPHREVAKLSLQELNCLRDSIVSVLQQSYAAGGASIRNYRNTTDDEGLAQLQFAVYGKKFDPMGNIVKKEITKDGRTTHWAPVWQC